MKLGLAILLPALICSCGVPTIVAGETYEGTIAFSDSGTESNATGFVYYSDTYQLSAAAGDTFDVELWSDLGARMNLEYKREEGYYPLGVCSTSGDGYGTGEVTITEVSKIFNVCLIETDVTEAGVGYSFKFTAR